jgi:serine/threonine protein kinase, bacterial
MGSERNFAGGPLGMMAALLIGCSSFSPGDGPADAGNVDVDGGNDGAIVGQVPATPSTPLGVQAAAVPVVATVTTLAGSGTPAFADGTGASASFNIPNGVAVDAAGNVYVADAGNHRIRKVTVAGVVTTLAGSGTATFADGSGAAASFNTPFGLALDAAGNVYVVDTSNNRVRRVTPAGAVTTLAGSGTYQFADGTGAAASFRAPFGIAVDKAANVYVADSANLRIRRVTLAGVVTTLAGSGTATFADGPGAAASFSTPAGVAVDLAGNVYVGDTSNERIRRVTPGGTVSTLAGSGTAAFTDGAGATANFNSPYGVAVDAVGNVYVADQNNHRIRRVTAAGVVTTLAGSGTATFADGVGAAASFNALTGIAVDAAGTVFVGDSLNHRIRKVASVGIGELVVSWTAPSSAGTSAISGYKASASAAGQTTTTCTTPSATTACTMRGMTSGVTYSVSVTATNSDGTSSPSGSVGAAPN